MDISGKKETRTEDGGDSFLELLAAYGIDCLFYNPGSDYYPVLEHLSQFQVEARERPKQIMCLTENAALSMAHGYSMKSGRVQAVMVHVGLGTMETGGSLHNIWRGREPLLLIAGRAPYTFENELPGGRDRPYQWDQEIYDQLGIARQFSKWTYELKTNSNLHHVIARAIQVANTDPKGPVYLVLPRELLAEKQDKVKILPVTRFGPPEPTSVGRNVLEQISEILLNSQSPVILTEYLGRDPAAVAQLVLLAEFLGAPVIEPQRKRMNFPADHHLYLPGFPRAALESADAILLLDIDVPWIPAATKLRSDAKIVHIDVDPTKGGFPLWGFPVDISVSGSTAQVLPDLLQILKTKRSREHRFQREERTEKISALGTKIRADLKSAAAPQTGTMKVESLLSLINELRTPDTIVMSQGVSNDPLVSSYIQPTVPGTFFASGGSSLGDGLGNTLGLKLASPSNDVMCVISDGSFVYSNPVSVLWASRKYQLPILTVIIDNGGYKAMKASVQRSFPQGFSKKHNVFAGVSMDPQPDFVGVAKACGAQGRVANNLQDLTDAMKQGLKETKDNKNSFVIDAVVECV